MATWAKPFDLAFDYPRASVDQKNVLFWLGGGNETA